MKKILLMITMFALVLLAIQAQAQDLKFKLKSEASIEDITIDGKTFEGGQYSSGEYYIWRISKKTDKKYRSPLGRKTDHTFNVEGNTYPVWTNKDKDKYWYYTTKNELPKRVYLIVEDE